MSERIRIGLFIDSFYPLIDGVIKVVDNYARCLSEYSDVTVFAPYYHKLKDKNEYPYPLVRSKVSMGIPGTGYFVPLPQLDAKWKTSMENARLDIVHMHTPFTIGREGLNYGKKYKVPVVATMHTQYKLDIQRTFKSESVSVAANRVLINTFDECDECWAVNQAVAKIYYNEYHCAVMPKVMENATDMTPLSDPAKARRRVNERFGLDDDTFLFLFVGRINVTKNILMIARAVGELKKMAPDKKFRLLFVGKGPDLDLLEDEIEECGLQKEFIYGGEIADRKMLASVFSRADLFLFPSVYDCASLVQIEAASQSTPVLFVEGAATASTIQNNVNGFLAPNDQTEYAKRILEIMRRPDLLHSVSLNARRDLYRTWQDAAREAYGRYLDLIERKKAGLL